MKKISFFGALLLFVSTISSAQTSSPIEMKKVFGGYQFKQGEQVLNMKSLVVAMESNARAYEKISKAKGTYNGAMALSFAGGALIGWPIGTAIFGGEPNWVLAGVGAGLIVASIPLSKKFNRQAKEAVEVYNSGLQASSFWQRSELKLNIQGNGIGLSLQF